MKGHYINGIWEKGSGALFTSTDPTTSEIIWQGNEGTAEEIKKAINAADAAFQKWHILTIQERIDYLKRFKDALILHKSDLSLVISKETGKPRWESIAEVTSMINKLDISIEAYAKRCADITIMQQLGSLTVRHKAHGIMAVFGPFNLPGHVPNGQIIPSLLSGNTVVYKPSELTPLVAEHIMHIWEESGIPPGVINLIQGGKVTGDTLLHHSRPNGYLFTGSSKTGQYFAKTLAPNPQKIVVLEMGGNNPLVIGEIKDLKAAAYMTIQSAFITSGQRCTCARRLIVPNGKLGDDFISTLVDMTKRLRIGPYYNDPEPFMGCVISKAAADHIIQKKQELIAQGAKILLNMEQLNGDSAFLSPGILDVTPIAKREDEEIFGPLLQVIRVSNFSDAINEANQTQYGLTAGLLSENPLEYEQFHAQVQAGVINWNTPLTGLSGAAPFGGVKFSGNHRPVGYYAADFCAYPVASLEATTLKMPDTPTPGFNHGS